MNIALMPMVAGNEQNPGMTSGAFQMIAPGASFTNLVNLLLGTLGDAGVDGAGEDPELANATEQKDNSTEFLTASAPPSASALVAAAAATALPSSAVPPHCFVNAGGRTPSALSAPPNAPTSPRSSEDRTSAAPTRQVPATSPLSTISPMIPMPTVPAGMSVDHLIPGFPGTSRAASRTPGELAFAALLTQNSAANSSAAHLASPAGSTFPLTTNAFVDISPKSESSNTPAAAQIEHIEPAQSSLVTRVSGALEESQPAQSETTIESVPQLTGGAGQQNKSRLSSELKPETTETARPVAQPELESAPVPKSQPAREISMRLPGSNRQEVDVQVIDRGGRVLVNVRTPDAQLAAALRDDLPVLVSNLDRAGFRAEMFTPAVAPAAQAREPLGSDTQFDKQSNGGNSRWHDGHMSGREQRQNSGRDQRRHSPMPEWLEEIEKSR